MFTILYIKVPFIINIEGYKMQKTNSELLDRANILLAILDKENICSSGSKEDYADKLKIVRTLTLQEASASKVPAPFLTSFCTTLLKIAACQELAQLFVLEYCIKYQKQDISVIFLGNTKLDSKEQKHCLVLIGNVIAPEELFIGREKGQPCAISYELFLFHFSEPRNLYLRLLVGKHQITGSLEHLPEVK
jgi:hypothetical protein